MELLTIQETADILKVSPVTVRRFIKSKRLPAVRVGRGLRVRREDLENVQVAVNKSEPTEPDADRTWGLFTKDDPLWELVGAGSSSEVPYDESLPSPSRDKYAALAEAYERLHMGR